MDRRARPKKKKAETKPARAHKGLTEDGAKIRDLENRLAEALKREAEALEQVQTRGSELVEAQEQRAATAEILRVISRSPSDVQPVFEAVLASGVRLCRASFGGVFRFDGELIHFVTSHEWPTEHLETVHRRFPMPPGDGSLAARAIHDRHVMQTPDYVANSRAGGWPEWVPGGEQRPRSTIAIPMLREGNPLGAIVLARAEPGLFSVTLVRERATRRGITLQATMDPRLGDVRADERKIKQVLLNLLSNALKFTPEGGGIDVRAAMNESLTEVSVSDTGVGIAPEDQDAIFEEFRQVGTAAKKVEGTGLGLTLCRKFVELHGGRIWVKSEVGVG